MHKVDNTQRENMLFSFFSIKSLLSLNDCYPAETWAYIFKMLLPGSDLASIMATGKRLQCLTDEQWPVNVDGHSEERDRWRADQLIKSFELQLF